MLKVFMKGFDRPYAVFGNFVFEDERFFVIENQGLRSKIPLANIFYIESVETERIVERASAQPQTKAITPGVSESLKRAVDQAMSKSSGALEEDTVATDKGEHILANVIFAGYKQKTFVIPILAELMDGTFSPKLSKAIFSNPQVAVFMDDFIMSGLPKVDGHNIIIQTAAIKEKTDVLKEKLETTTKFLNKVMSASVPQEATLGLDTKFAMTGSPFTTTISLQDNDEL